jgi:hypothetical protein
MKIGKGILKPRQMNRMEAAYAQELELRKRCRRDPLVGVPVLEVTAGRRHPVHA